MLKLTERRVFRIGGKIEVGCVAVRGREGRWERRWCCDGAS